MKPPDPAIRMTRRHFFGRGGTGLGIAGLAHLLGKGRRFAGRLARAAALRSQGQARHLSVPERRGPRSSICSTTSRGSNSFTGTELPDSIRRGQRLTGMTASQTSFPVHKTWFEFRQHGESGAWVSELLPYTARIADKLSFIRTMHTEAINHDPAVTFFQTGAQLAGRPSLGAWLAYGLGSENDDLPAFVVMTSRGSGRVGQALYTRLWGSGFLPSRFQGVKFRSQGDPVLYLSNPDGVSRDRRRMFPRRSLVAQPDPARRSSPTRKSKPASRNTRWLSACRRPCRNSWISRGSPNPRSSCTASRRASPVRTLAIAWSLAG